MEDVITERGAELIYLPPYSPDYSPIESCWSKLKTKLRSLKTRTSAELDEAISKAANTIYRSKTSYGRDLFFTEWIRHRNCDPPYRLNYEVTASVFSGAALIMRAFSSLNFQVIEWR